MDNSFTLDIQELRRPECIHRLQVHWWSTIKEIKTQLYRITMEPPSQQHLYHATKASELKNSWTLHDMEIDKSGTVLRVAIDYSTRPIFTLSSANNVILDAACVKMINDAKLGFQKGKLPSATDEFEGSGGVYFLRNANGGYGCVFKPHDEEQGMPNNPKDHAGTGQVGLREYFHPGQGCLREVAAYIMDYNGFCKVPPTTLVHCEHPSFHHPSSKVHGGKGEPFPKLGSLQKFIHAKDTFDDIGYGLLNDFEIQKIALFDMRVLNCDRNGANMLVLHKQPCYGDSDCDENGDDDMCAVSPVNHYELVPIDHGYCMPSRLKISSWDWAWYTCSQISNPVLPEIVDYLHSIDIDDLLKKIKMQASISDDCVFLLEIVHHLLVKGIEDGLTLKDIATLIARDGDDETMPSRLESLINEAEENAYRAIESRGFRSKVHTPSRLSQMDAPPNLMDSTDSNMSSDCLTDLPVLLPVVRERGGSSSSSSNGTDEETSPKKVQSESMTAFGPPVEAHMTAFKTMRSVDHPQKPLLKSIISLQMLSGCAASRSVLEGQPLMAMPSVDVTRTGVPMTLMSPKHPSLKTITKDEAEKVMRISPNSPTEFPSPPMSRETTHDVEYSQLVEVDDNSAGSTPMNIPKFDTNDETDHESDQLTSIPEAPPLVRVATFSGFDSNPVYNNMTNKAMGNLKLERRRAIYNTPEFSTLRRHFAMGGVESILNRMTNKNKRIRNNNDTPKEGVVKAMHI